MATPINPENSQDWDEPLNTDPDFRSTHVFSTADITVTFGGETVGTIADPLTVFDTTGSNGTKNADGTILYPIDSEFGFYVDDFNEAIQKELDGDYAEGWAGDVKGTGGEQIGIVVSDSPTDTFKTPAVLGTWLAGIGGNTVKASTEHYSVMQNVLSDAQYPGDPDADYALDDNLILLSQNEAWDGQYVADLLADPLTYGVVDKNGDGILDIRDLLNPNESTIEYDIAYSTDYSVTMKDDGKLLYRWGNTIKRPNDIRLEAEMDLPDEWTEDDVASQLRKLYQVTQAELVVHHTITNNPNDQIRPEDYENESAIGTLPTFEIVEDYNLDGNGPREVWVSTDDYYAGDGTFYPAGTILRDDYLADQAAASDAAALGLVDASTLAGYTNAWFTTMDREPFEPDLNDAGTDYDTGPRWRLKPDKYGQDLPSVVIPIDPSDPPPPTQDEVKYDVGAETQTVINLLDWATEISPLSISAGWQNNAGDVSVNGVNLSENFDVAVYIKGDVKPATVYSAELLLDYQEIPFHADGDIITGTEGSDYLVGIGNNTFTGLGGADLFVLSYGTSVTNVVTASTITDFEIGLDKIGLIGFDALAGFDAEDPASAALITQAIAGDDVTVSVDGELVATLEGLADDLDTDLSGTIDPGEGLSLLDSFFVSNPMPAEPPAVNEIIGTEGNDTLVGTEGVDLISGLGGDDLLSGLGGNDTLDGGLGADTLIGGAGADSMDGGGNVDTLSYETSSAAVTVKLFNGTFEGGDATGDTATRVDNLIGSAFDDILSGNYLANVIEGGDGADRLEGGAGVDTLSYASSDGRVVVDLFNGNVFLADAEGDVFSGFENLSGSAYSDYLLGNHTENALMGAGGNDRLDGRGGNDSLYGGSGNDTLTGNTGDDHLTGGQGADVFVFRSGDAFDVIDDWEDGVDLIDASSFGLTFEQIASAASDLPSGDLQIDFGGGDLLQINGLLSSDLDESDFILTTIV